MTTMTHGIKRRINTLRLATRSALVVAGVGRLLIGGELFLALTLAGDRIFTLERGFRAVLLLGGILLLGLLLKKYLLALFTTQLADDEMALALERGHPFLNQALVSALQISRLLNRPDLGPNDSREMMTAAVSGGEQQARQATPARGLGWRSISLHISLLGGATGVLLFAFAFMAPTLSIWAQRQLFLQNTPWPRYTTLTALGAQGDTLFAPRGEDLPIFIHATGVIPGTGRIYWETESGENGNDPMARVGQDKFRHQFHAISQPLSFSIRAGDGRLGPLKVIPVDRPTLRELGLTINAPAYTDLEPQAIDLLTQEGPVAILQGADLVLTGTTDQGIKDITITIGRETVPGTIDDAGKNRFSVKLKPLNNITVEIHPRNTYGLTPKPPPRIFIQVRPDQAPEVSLRAQGVGTMVSPRVRIPLRIKAADDVAITLLEIQQALKTGEDDRDYQFQPVTVTGLEDFQAGEDSFLGDLLWRSNGLKLTPGQVLFLRAHAVDRFEPLPAHTTTTQSLSFKVVPEEVLLKELLRRQGEIRAELEAAEESLSALREDIVRSLEPPQRLPLSLHGFVVRLGGTAERMATILDEWENNRLPGGQKVSSLRYSVVYPLSDQAVPALSAAREKAAAWLSGQAEAAKKVLPPIDLALATLRRVLKALAKIEDFQRVVEITRSLLRTQGEAREALQQQLEAELKDLFGEKNK